MKKKQNLTNQQPLIRPNFGTYPGLSEQMAMNPQFRMPMMAPGSMTNPNIPLMPQNFPLNIQPNIQPPNMMPNMMYGGQFNQPQVGGRGGYKPHPRNN